MIAWRGYGYLVAMMRLAGQSLCSLRRHLVMNWCLSSGWETEGPDQESVIKLSRNLNAWRKGTGKVFLCHGRMEKPYKVSGTYDIPMITTIDRKIYWPSVFTSRWTSPDNRQAQILVNYTDDPQNISLCCSGRLRVYTNPYSSDAGEVSAKTELEIRPLSAVLVEFMS